MVVAAVVCFGADRGCALVDLDRLSERQIVDVKELITRLSPFITAREQEGTLPTLTFESLYARLGKKDRTILSVFRHLPAKKIGVKIPFRGMATGGKGMILVKGQIVKAKDRPEAKEIAPQYLPIIVYDYYQVMMGDMEKSIGRRLYVESGYRSSAHQLYLFIFYLKNHGYSIRETVKYVALPGYSEHGDPRHQAIDFINEKGINGEDDPKEFEDLPEYRWLVKNAGKYGFELSYPKDSKDGLTYEPWHWRFTKNIP